ncbi:hypothetical protein DPMN_156436 [Dreissena polymorpha]|uniref:Uncharacterized protein n=1 Tax=Dreissena polymorpha TaxID=45954 RepID=A0A9D4FT66_DREPO|nr:hypothetical protein DPMN_156435 [Dreissena polymorpha]KAH3802754.1 hypothetical protein DPMN_156436 [Dreissena polymorpha]
MVISDLCKNCRFYVPFNRCSQSRANRQEADDAASRDLSSMPCSATPLVAIVDGSEWADKIQVISSLFMF